MWRLATTSDREVIHSKKRGVALEVTSIELW